MKKSVLVILALILSVVSFGQLTGNRYIPGSGGPNDYPTIALAIADLNLQGVGNGGVTFNITAGYTETFAHPQAGLITATGYVQSPVVFRKWGTGANPLIIAATGNSATTDGIIKIAGGDYITFDGINLAENAGNFTATAQMEWGFALVKARATYPVDGCQFVTIKNSTITLNAENANSTGIYSGNHLANSQTSISNSIVGLPDLMNNCRFYANNISNVCSGFKLSGYNDPSQVLFDQNNEVGIPDSGNVITNIGSAANATYGIYGTSQTNMKIAWNTVSGGNTTGNLEAITTRVANSVEIHHNTVSVGNATGTSGIYGIDTYSSGIPGYTIDIHDNVIQNCFHQGTGSFTAITGGNGSPTTMNIYNNVVKGNIVGTGSFTGLDGSAAANNNIFNNQVYNNTKTGAGNMYLIRAMYYSISIHDNQVYSNNAVTTGVVTSGVNLHGITGTQNSQNAEAIYNNEIYDLNIQGTSTATNNNLYGINAGVLPGANQDIHNNTIRNLSINTPAGSGTVYGIRFGDGNICNAYKNRIFDLSASNAAGIVYGISTTGAVQSNIFNNFISDLKTPSSIAVTAVNGIHAAGGTSVGIFFNTVFLNALSTGSTFGSSGIYRSSSSVVLDLRNNVIMNASVPGPSGLTVAYRGSSAFNTNNYAPTSNANNFWAGTPDASHLIYFDGTYSDMTIAGFQTRVSPRDLLSFTENSPLMNTTTAPYDLHMNPTVPTDCESAGVPVTTPPITDDVDGNPRSANPDAGAHEFAGTGFSVVNPSGLTAATISSRQVNLLFAPNVSGNEVVIVWNNTGYFSAPAGTPPAVNSSFAGGTVLYKGIGSPVSHTGLTGGVTYYYKAFSWNGSAYSSGIIAQATLILAPPSAFTGYTLASDRIDLSWQLNAQNHNVIVAVNSTSTFGQPANGTDYPVNSAIPSGGSVIYSGPLTAFSHTSLSANTTYYYKIWSVDAFNYYSAAGSATNVTTMACASTSSLPYNEGFESYTAPSVGCGIVIDGDKDGSTWAVGTIYPHGGLKSLSCATTFSFGVDTDDWYIMQGLNLTAGTSYKLSFWYRGRYTSSAVRFETKWGPSPVPSAMYSAPLYTYTSGYVLTMTEAICIVTPETSGTYYFAWHCTSPGGSSNSIAIDDISVSSNTCPMPLTLTGSNITSGSAEISWTGAANVQIEYGTPGHTPGSGTIITTSANPYTVTGLAPMTTYDVYVRQDCGLATFSFWKGPFTFTTGYAAPVITTEAATSLTGTGATLNGTANANGVSTSVYFEYGLTSDYGFVASSTPASATGTAPTAVAATVANLIPNGVTYHYRTVGFSGGVVTYGPDITFVTPQIAPSVTTSAATGLSGSGATLNGSVNANNADATVTFEYGADATYGSTVTAVPSLVTGALTKDVSATISGLTAGNTYHYRVNATNAAGTVNGSDMTFTAASLPTVSTLAASSVGTTTATLNGLVNPNDYTTTVTFRYGTTPAYGTTVTATQSPVTGNAATPVTFDLTGLTMNTVYHYQVVGVNAAGTVYGANMTFTTGTIPTVTTLAVTQANSGVTLRGTVSANNSTTMAYFEYGTTTAYGTTIAFSSNPVTTQNRSVTQLVNSGLMPSTTYNYRIYATNAGGTSYGENLTFTTPVAATVTTEPATPVGTTTATMRGTINPNSVSTAYKFEYGLTTAYGSTSNPTPSSGSGSTVVTLTRALTGLQPNTTYNYRMVGTNAGGPYYGANMTFTTNPVAPAVITVAASGITPVAAILNGTVNAQNAATSVSFEYGLTTSYGSTVNASPEIINGSTVTGTSALVAGLLPNTTYNYRVKGSNSGGITNGSNISFTTLPVLPLVTTLGVTEPTYTSATLHGLVNANNAATTVYFEYGLTDAYGQVIPAVPSPVIGMSDTDVSADIAGLTGNQVYHYRVISVNAAGVSYGNDMTFNSVPDPLLLGGVATDVTGCFGNSNGSVTTTVTGGVKPYSYLWSNGATTSSLTDLAAGEYSLTVTDAVSLSISDSWVISQPEEILLTATIEPSVNPVCSGNEVTFSVTTVNGGTSPVYAWHVNGGDVAGTGISYSYIPVAGDVVSCVVTSDLPCVTNNPASAVFIPSVTTSLPVGVSISVLPAPVVSGSMATLTATPQNPGDSPQYQWFVNTIPAGANGPVFQYVPASGDQVYCILTSSEVCTSGNPATSNVITIQTVPAPVSVSIQNLTVNSSQSYCIDAFEMIQTAGDPNRVTVDDGGSLTLIAGQRIHLYSGTTVHSGGYLHAYISNEFCGGQAPTLPGLISGTQENMVINEFPEFVVYPNPTKGDFTVEIKNDVSVNGITTEIFNMQGERVFSGHMENGRKFLVRFNDSPAGLYFVRIVGQGRMNTFKVIKN